MPSVMPDAPASESVADSMTTGSRLLLPGEIPGVQVKLHRVGKDELTVRGDRLQLVVLFLISGTATIRSGSASAQFADKTCYVARPGEDIVIRATGSTEVLEVDWALTEQDYARVDLAGGQFPMVQPYADSPQYRDYFKSEKTISRTLVGPHVLPRFCMGSVESIGPDRIEPHAHPMLDQLFFSFAENDIVLLIDGQRHALGGSTLLHIPLGSDHGVEVPPGQRMHYLWLDFFQRHEDMDYIAEVHKDVPLHTL
ncbi:hypothetical protein [Kaistia terrae]|uniref:Cupin domain-containing protein n=1 Tax=Kaistia terrae TaxID=537017 RepID=A0ABW0PNL1_9HYPH|nr:hypothetical protein [Kaistia terrae]MCX5580064.1 hypothetical protein [Kaistia terrae]